MDQIKCMSESHLLTFVDSIIPVITKCKPNNTNDDYDLDFIKKEIEDIFIDYFKIQQPDIDSTKESDQV